LESNELPCGTKIRWFLNSLLCLRELIKYVMGQSERVMVDLSRFADAGELTLRATGLRAQREVDKLVDRLGAAA
jgi:hypothetical protein